MPRPRDERPLPPHDSIIEGPYLGRYLGKGRMMVKIQCPRCLNVRDRTASEARRELERPGFKGYCRQCSMKAVGEGAHRWANHRKQRKGVSSNGYCLTYPSTVEDGLLPMYRAMQSNGQPLLTHRWVMAKHLGRPLRSDELVDHKNGCKDHNDVGNLRIYVRGKQQPGSAPGHGTYYHEWQMAERRIRELEEEISTLKNLPFTHSETP